MAISLRITLSLGFVFLFPSGIAVTKNPKGATYCEFYNANLCGKSATECPKREECPPPSPGKRNHCYVLWQHNNVTKTSTLKMKGCFFDSKECYDKVQCVENNIDRMKQMFFCCCDGNMCNDNYKWDPKPVDKNIINGDSEADQNPDLIFMTTVLSVSLSISILTIVLFLLYCHYKRKQFSHDNHPSPLELILQEQSSPNLDLRSIQLVEMKTRGRFAAVWRAEFKNETVAVKIFPNKGKQSWQTEQEIFRLPHMHHEDILHFIGSERNHDDLKTEFWLVTVYHEKGSLYDYLKANVVTWSETCKIAESIARGLMHLHEEIPADKVHGQKPVVAHRDFKSTNVLLKADMRACIADFGLALVFHPDKLCGDTHGQVGTRRYMAPEVLEGAINFTRDSFLRIDIYACALVLWELASRCAAHDGLIGEYTLPFEEEIGMHPTLMDMQEIVVHNKVRPLILESWRKHSGLLALCDTIEECWDHDAEARLSASCVTERISGLSQSLDVDFSTVIKVDNIDRSMDIKGFDM
ncbi:activin receptor type-2A [Diachasma alloeum]|uniref:activin receptor type-2A n=1 Tax=Diachasma alloeum TaxID=454923 RepID=UPI0007383F0B|nr:activin receptor type-2A [Diachasma alloeum]